MKRTDAYESTSDVVARMDAAIDHRCACGCGLALAADGPSGYFASQECQREWASTQATNPTDVYERPDADHYPIPAVEAGRDWHAETVEERLRQLRGMVEERRERARRDTAGAVYSGAPGAPEPDYSTGAWAWSWAAVNDGEPTRVPSTPPGAGWRIVVEWEEDGQVDITHFGSPVRTYMSGTWYTVRMFDARGREVARERRRGDFPY